MTIKELKKIYKECKVIPYVYGDENCEGTIIINGSRVSICGYRDCDPYGCGWGNKGACIIYDGGKYQGRSADVPEKAKELILIKIRELKEETIKQRKTAFLKDFE